MLNMGGIVSSLFQLILGVPSKLAPTTINKGLKVPEVFLEEILELRPHNQSGAFMVALVLGIPEADGAMEECGGKGGMFHFCSA